MVMEIEEKARFTNLFCRLDRAGKDDLSRFIQGLIDFSQVPPHAEEQHPDLPLKVEIGSIDDA